MKLFTQESTNAKYNAQRSLSGLTHYVDDDTLRFHHSRILKTFITDGGLLFSLIESCSLDMHNTKRGFRFVTFDVFGTVVSRVELEQCSAVRASAEKAMWHFLNNFDARSHTLAAIDRQQARFIQECDAMRVAVGELPVSQAA